MNKILLSIASLLFAVPAMAQTTTGPTGCAIGSTCTSSLTPVSVNGVISADQMSGADIGTKITAAFASCAAPNGSCKVTIPPGQIYSFSHTITIPGDVTATNSVMQLDCQGSTLTWTGTGDAIQVLSANVGNPSGYIANCTIMNGTSNTASTNAIHQFSRNAFEYRTVAIQGFGNANSSGIFLDNVAETWGGYNERTLFDHVTVFHNKKGIRLFSDGGTNSFARQVMRGVFCNATDGQICLSIEGNGGFQSANAYNGFFDLRGNLEGTATGSGAARGVSVTNGGDIATGVINLGFEGPSTTNLYYIDSSTSFIGGEGTVDGGPAGFFNGGTSDSFNVPNMSAGGAVLQSVPFANSDAQALNAKLALGGNTLRFGIPNVGPNYAYYQLYMRTTTNPSDPEVDAEPATGNTQTNLFYCNIHGCGFGAGYGPTATRGGTLNPNHNLAFNGTFGNQAGTSGTDADGTTYAVGTNYNLHSTGAIINTAGFGYAWGHVLSTTPASDALHLDLINPSSTFLRQVMLIRGDGTVMIPNFAIGSASPVLAGVQGIGTKAASTTGTFTPGNLRKTDANGTEVDFGSVGASFTVTLTNCTITFVGGIATAHTGTACP
jgi:hypothetical protein